MRRSKVIICTKGGVNVTRIKQLRTKLGLTQEEFGKRIGVKRNTIACYESGSRTPTDQSLMSICREFNVREDWLRNGNGEIFEEMSGEEKVASLLGKIFTDKDSDIYDFKMAVFRELGKLEEKDWSVIQRLVDGITKE